MKIIENYCKVRTVRLTSIPTKHRPPCLKVQAERRSVGAFHLLFSATALKQKTKQKTRCETAQHDAKRAATRCNTRYIPVKNGGFKRKKLIKK